MQSGRRILNCDRFPGLILGTMTTVETTAIADDESHLVLQKPLAWKTNGPFRVIVMMDEQAPGERRLGHLKGRASCRIGADFAMNDDEFLSA